VVLGIPGLRARCTLLRPPGAASPKSAISNWHDHVRSNIRKSDAVTMRVLDLVDNHLLQVDPALRLSSTGLLDLIAAIVREAWVNPGEDVADHTLYPPSVPGLPHPMVGRIFQMVWVSSHRNDGGAQKPTSNLRSHRRIVTQIKGGNTVYRRWMILESDDHSWCRVIPIESYAVSPAAGHAIAYTRSSSTGHKGSKRGFSAPPISHPLEAIAGILDQYLSGRQECRRIIIIPTDGQWDTRQTRH
jgi:hypothetical protein